MSDARVSLRVPSAQGEVPAATAQNVPGLELALAEPKAVAPPVEAVAAAETAPKAS